MALLDPWGAQNLLTLGQDYLQLGQKDKARAIGNKLSKMSNRPEIVNNLKPLLGA
jgi:Flp pilus assembly protein TadD